LEARAAGSHKARSAIASETERGSDAGDCASTRISNDKSACGKLFVLCGQDIGVENLVASRVNRPTSFASEIDDEIYFSA
jgi:hypothetical protein